MSNPINWGPNGLNVYERTYSRPKPNGSMETWPETVERVVDGNLGLVPARYIEPDERERLIALMSEFKILPAGRHLWASGVPGRQFLFNCHVSGWGEKFSDHFTFQLLRSAEGGGVGANYSSRYLEPYGPVRQSLTVHIVCDPSHPDYEKMRAAGVLSGDYVSDWAGAYEVGDSREGWASAMGDLLDTFFREDVRHSNRVYDVSVVRPEGARLKTFGGTASGPLPFARMMLRIAEILNGSRERTGLSWRNGTAFHVLPLEAMAIDHALGECVVAGGVRRTARMSIVRWDDPQVFDFIRCKADTSEHWTTNISVEIDDRFLRFLEAEIPEAEVGAYPPGVDPRQHARDVLAAVAEGMLANGEPGLWNSSLSNVGEPNPVICTNPCGEIALEMWENCNLGHINLDAYWDDFDGAVEAHRLMTRFLIRATYGDVNDAKQAETLARNRRIGVGHFGYQGWVVKNGVRYSESSHAGSHVYKYVPVSAALSVFGDEVRDAADQYAFQLRIPSPVKVTTVAPTGTIAKMPGRTEGIHPIYSRFFNQRVRFSLTDPAQDKRVSELSRDYEIETDIYDASGNTAVVVFPTKDNLVSEVEAMGLDPSLVESVDEIPLADLLAVQAMYQREYADNAVSFTANVDPNAYTPSELAATLTKFLPALKGTTVFPDLSRPQAPYERITELEWWAAQGGIGDGIDEDCATGACPVR